MFQQDENLLNTQYGADEIEMLQTDIQRFLAILAFCLLPVFMLVQSIPVVSYEKNTVIEKLSRRIEEQNGELDRLRKENVTLNEDMGRLLNDPDINGRLRVDLNKAMERISHQREKIEALVQEKILGQNDLTSLKRQLMERDVKIRKLIREKNQVKRLFEKATKGLKAFIQKELKPDTDVQVAKEEKGLYVAFESDSAFIDLLETGKIQLFIHVTGAKQTFRAIRMKNRIQFKPGAPLDGLDLWEIKKIMIPREILDAFRKWTTLATREMMFVVGLSSDLSRQIREKEVQAGRILIDRDGKVQLRAHGK